MSWDSDLTPGQRQAASHRGSHARLLAGPGTGKTTTLTRRVLWLVTKESVPAGQILALTFTRAAASELRRKVKDNLITVSGGQPKVSTLHSFALRQLLRNASRTRLPQPLRIADDYEERWIIVEELKGLVNQTVRKTEELLNELSADWQRLTADSTDWERRFPNPAFLGAWKEHREVYGYTLRSELVYQLKRALEEQSLDLEGPPKYVLVDEYQDLNACDLAVIRSLASQESEIYCAGDDDQSIYGFRFANPDGIRRFPNDFQPGASLVLDLCQRCDSHILDYGLYVARQDLRRIEKVIKTKKGAGTGEVHVLRFRNQEEEAKSIAVLCSWLTNVRRVNPEEILILLRSDRNRQFSNPIRNAITQKGIPVATVSNPLEPLNQPLGREMLCLMRLINNRRDHLSWRTILSVRQNSIGSSTFSNLYELARREGVTFSEILQQVNNTPTLLTSRGSAVATEVRDIENLLDQIRVPGEGNLEAWVQNLADSIIKDKYQQTEIIALFQRIRKAGEVDTLEDLLRALNVSLGEAEQEKERGSVAIMTMHQAKGLSADAVIIAAAEDEYIPGRALGEAIDDERRLLYVSLTRARHYLYVSFCERRTGQQRHTGRNSGTPQRTFSRFLSGGPHPPKGGVDFMRNLPR